ncbi:MAG TPA: CapA family protein, partial [Thermomicrobiales bacterium]|nr:CapA family protein [Thermomicrobiales bacterium]
VIACDAIRPSSRAKPGKVGTLNCRQGPMRESIREANENADVVIVFPHWGVEYYPTPRTYQRRLAAEWVDAGADLIIGAHSHFPGGMEDIDGRLVFYSLGNFIFDQDFRQATMMGLVPEMTFNGDRLVQVWLHTTLIVDTQPNLANPETDGQFAYDLVRRGSRGLLDY